MSHSLITISSSKAVQEDPTVDPSDFIAYFNPPLDLGGIDHEVCLLKANLWNTAVNITDGKIDWGYGAAAPGQTGANNFQISIPTGNYTVTDLNNLLKDSLEEEGVTGVDGLSQPTYPISIDANFNTDRVEVTIANALSAGQTGFYLDLTQPDNVASLLGFTEQIIGVNTSATSVANVNGGADQYQIRCDLIRNSYDPTSSGSGQSDILFSFVPAVPVSANIDVDPTHLVYLQVNKPIIYSIRMRITDQDGDPINMNGEQIIYNLLVRKIGSD